MMNGTAQDFAERGSRGFTVLARLKPGLPHAQAQTELDGISKRLEAAYPQTNEGRAVEVASLDHELFGDIHKPLLVLLCAVAFVLLIACTNVANLLLARSEARQREIAMRIALGAGRARVLLPTRRRKLRAGLSRRSRRTAAGQLGRQSPDGLQPDHLPQLHSPWPRPACGALYRDHLLRRRPAPGTCSRRADFAAATSTMRSSRPPATPPIIAADGVSAMRWWWPKSPSPCSCWWARA